MSKSFSSLYYADETDRCFGLAGMAISLVVWDSEELLRGIDLTAPAEEALQLSPDFYFIQSPKTGAKAVWESTLQHFQLIAAMTVANVACRHMVRKNRSTINGEIDSDIRRFLNTEGADLCQLEPDEVGSIYNKVLAHCSRIFRHPGVCQLAVTLSDTIADKKTLASDTILEMLQPLNRM